MPVRIALTDSDGRQPSSCRRARAGARARACRRRCFSTSLSACGTRKRAHTHTCTRTARHTHTYAHAHSTAHTHTHAHASFRIDRHTHTHTYTVRTRGTQHMHAHTRLIQDGQAHRAGRVDVWVEEARRELALRTRRGARGVSACAVVCVWRGCVRQLDTNTTHSTHTHTARTRVPHVRAFGGLAG